MDDLISRADAIGAIRAMQTYKLFAGDDLILVNQAGAQTELMMLPSAEPERKTGKWTEKKVFYKPDASKVIEEWQSARCNQCGRYHTTPYMYFFEDFNFCPICGADMRGEQDE